MSRRKKFDRFMVTNDNGHNLKLARLSDAEFRAVVQGIWPIASEASPRGAFMVGRMPATAADVAFKAPKVTVKAAQAAIDKLRQLGMLEHDDELGGEWVHDWDEVNPAPKTDPSNADRQRRFRQRNAARNAGGNGSSNAAPDDAVTPPEVEGEEGTTADAVSSDAEAPDPVVARLCQLHSDLCRARTDTPASSKRMLPTKAWHTEMDRLMRLDGYSAEQVEYVIRWVDRDQFWGANCLSVESLRRHFATFAARIKADQQPKSRPTGLTDEKADARRARAAEAFGDLMAPTAPDDIEGKEAA